MFAPAPDFRPIEPLVEPAAAPAIDKGAHFWLGLAFSGVAHAATFAIAYYGVGAVLLNLVADRERDPLLVPSFALVGVSVVLVISVIVWSRYVRYCEQLWLGEVARRVDRAYLLPWSQISQVTRSMPIARPLLGRGKKYTLTNRLAWGLRGSETFRIIVPARVGAPIVVERRD